MAFAMLKAKNRFSHVLALEARTKVIINYIARPDRYFVSRLPPTDSASYLASRGYVRQSDFRDHGVYRSILSTRGGPFYFFQLVLDSRSPRGVRKVEATESFERTY